jgi:hypothetical protein
MKVEFQVDELVSATRDARKEINDIAKANNGLKNDIKALGAKVGTVKNELETKIDTVKNALETKTDTKFDSVIAKFDLFIAKFDAFNAKIDYKLETFKIELFSKIESSKDITKIGIGLLIALVAGVAVLVVKSFFP